METSEDATDARSSLQQAVVIVGLPGVGKSTVGRRAARVLGWNFVDLDSHIEKREGKKIREIFADAGEETFRDLESEALREVLSSPSPVVLATGGGIIVRAANRTLLKKARSVIWLTASIADLETRLQPRVGSNRGNRPLLDGDFEENLQKLKDERESLYTEVATDVLSTEGQAFSDVVERLIALIEMEDKK